MTDEPISSRLRTAEGVLLAGAVGLYVLMPHSITADGEMRLETTRQLLGGVITAAQCSILQSILAAPMYLIGQAIGSPTRVVSFFNTAVLLVGLAAMVRLLSRDVSADIVRRFALLLLTASMFDRHAQQFFGEVLTVICVGVGLLYLVQGRAAAGYVLATIGVVNTPATIPALFLALLDRARTPRRVWQAVWPTAIASALVMLEFYIRRGSPFDSGYEGHYGFATVLPYSGRPGFSYPFVFGVLSILFSFGKGLAIFIPGLWLMFRRPVSGIPNVLRRFQHHSAWFLAGLVLVYAKWWAWYGGAFWGPRFFLFGCLPASIALAIHLSDRAAGLGAKALTLAILTWSLWVGLDGMVFGTWAMDICGADQYRLESLCWYTPEFSALFRPFVVTPPLTVRNAGVGVYYAALWMVLAGPFALDLVRAGADRLRRARRERPQTLQSASR